MRISDPSSESRPASIWFTGHGGTKKPLMPSSLSTFFFGNSRWSSRTVAIAGNRNAFT